MHIVPTSPGSIRWVGARPIIASDTADKTVRPLSPPFYELWPAVTLIPVLGPR
jgi:hypothetical protein